MTVLWKLQGCAFEMLAFTIVVLLNWSCQESDSVSTMMDLLFIWKSTNGRGRTACITPLCEHTTQPPPLLQVEWHQDFSIWNLITITLAVHLFYERASNVLGNACVHAISPFDITGEFVANIFSCRPLISIVQLLQWVLLVKCGFTRHNGIFLDARSSCYTSCGYWKAQL